MRDLYWAYRFFAAMILGVVGAIATGNPLYLGITVAAFIAMALWVWRRGSVYEPKWEPLASRGENQGTNGAWTDALASFEAAMKKCRSPRERREASEQIGAYLMRNGRIGDAEPYLRQAVNITTAGFGPAHPTTTALRDQLSDLYMQTGQAGLAAQLQGRAAATAAAGKVERLGAAAAVARYAEILQQSGDLAAAAAQYQRTLQTIDATKTDGPELIPVLLSAARYAGGAGDRQRTEDLLRRAGRCVSQDTPRRIVDEVRSALVDLLVAEERYAEAVKEAQQGLTGQAHEPAVGARVRRQLADLMEKAGMAEEAAKQRRLAKTLDAMVATPESP